MVVPTTVPAASAIRSKGLPERPSIQRCCISSVKPPYATPMAIMAKTAKLSLLLSPSARVFL